MIKNTQESFFDDKEKRLLQNLLRPLTYPARPQIHRKRLPVAFVWTRTLVRWIFCIRRQVSSAISSSSIPPRPGVSCGRFGEELNGAARLNLGSARRAAPTIGFRFVGLRVRIYSREFAGRCLSPTGRPFTPFFSAFQLLGGRLFKRAIERCYFGRLADKAATPRASATNTPQQSSRIKSIETTTRHMSVRWTSFRAITP